MIWFYYLLNILLLTGLTYGLWRHQPESAIKKYFLPALLLKLGCGLLMAFFYQHFFGGGDANLFQNQSNYVTEFARVSPLSYIRLLLTRHFESETLRTAMIYVWYSNSYFMVMLLSFLNLFTHSHFYLNSLYFSFFCFWGLWQLSQTLFLFNPAYKWPALISFLFLPSVLFWAAGISKEAIYLGSLGWLLAATVRLVNLFPKFKWQDILVVLVAGFFLWKIKFYFAALVFTLLLGYVFVTILRKYTNLNLNRLKLWFIFLGLLLLASVAMVKFNEEFELNNFYFQLMRSYTVLAERSAGKPMVVYPQLEPTLLSLVRHSPAAILNATLRPYIWERNSLFYTLAGAENLAVMVLLFLTGVKLIKKPLLSKNIGLVVVLIYIIVTAFLIGLSTPNLGSLSRYKTAFIPFVVFLCLNVIYRNKRPY